MCATVVLRIVEVSGVMFIVPVTSYSSFKDSLSFWGMRKYRRKELERYMVGVITLYAYQGHETPGHCQGNAETLKSVLSSFFVRVRRENDLNRREGQCGCIVLDHNRLGLRSRRLSHLMLSRQRLSPISSLLTSTRYQEQ
jgi:hypothetical protein